MIECTSTSCILSVIQMSAGLTDRNLGEHVSFFSQQLPGLASRFPGIYSVYRYFAFEVRFSEKSILQQPRTSKNCVFGVLKKTCHYNFSQIHFEKQLNI